MGGEPGTVVTAAGAPERSPVLACRRPLTAPPAPGLEPLVRQRLAAALRVLLDQVCDGSIELTVVPGAGRAAVLEHLGIRPVLVVDPGTGNGYGLSPRELEIARLVAAGATNQAIADGLGISSWTVSTHLRRVFATTGVCSRAEMVTALFAGLQLPL